MAALLAHPGRALLASDYDGTLAPIVLDPSHAAAQPGAVAALVRLAEHLGGLAVVTGRPAATAVALGGLDAIPELVVFGAYGAHRWQRGVVTDLVPDSLAPDPGAARTAVQRVVDSVTAGSARVELKGPALAVHVRGCSEPADALAALLDPLRLVATSHGLIVEPGRLVIELRPPGVDKGRTLRAYAEQVGARQVTFLGDDLGDLAAFAAVEAMRGQGITGLTVTSASAEAPDLVGAADLVVDGPAGVVALLTALADALEATGHDRT